MQDLEGADELRSLHVEGGDNDELFQVTEIFEEQQCTFKVHVTVAMSVTTLRRGISLAQHLTQKDRVWSLGQTPLAIT